MKNHIFLYFIYLSYDLSAFSSFTWPLSLKQTWFYIHISILKNIFHSIIASKEIIITYCTHIVLEFAFSIIILSIDFGLQLFETGDVKHTVFEFDCHVVVLAEQLHDLFLSAALKCRSVFELETEISFVKGGSSLVLLFWDGSLIFGCHFSEEVVSVEQPVGPDSNSCHPDWSDSSQPPGIGLGDEVSVVKHNQLLSTHHLFIDQYIKTSHSNEQNRRTIESFQYLNWPDTTSTFLLWYEQWVRFVSPPKYSTSLGYKTKNLSYSVFCL